jgi:hypothetical protein
VLVPRYVGDIGLYIRSPLACLYPTVGQRHKCARRDQTLHHLLVTVIEVIGYMFGRCGVPRGRPLTDFCNTICRPSAAMLAVTLMNLRAYIRSAQFAFACVPLRACQPATMR